MYLCIIYTTVKKTVHYSGGKSPYVWDFIPAIMGKIPHKKKMRGKNVGDLFLFSGYE